MPDEISNWTKKAEKAKNAFGAKKIELVSVLLNRGNALRSENLKTLARRKSLKKADFEFPSEDKKRNSYESSYEAGIIESQRYAR